MQPTRGTFSSLSRGQKTVLLVLGGAVVLAAATLIVVATRGGSAPTTTVAAVTTTAAPPPATTPPTVTTTPTTSAPTTTTTEATTTTTEPTTTTTVDPLEVLVLEPDGLGDIPFGTGAEETVARLRELLGDPDEDTGWISSFSAFGTCPGTELRVVRWKTLEVFLSDGPTDWAPAGYRHFFSYSNSALLDAPLLDLTTREGLRIGSTVADVRAFYGDDSVVVDDPYFDPQFINDVPGAGFMWGLVSGGEPTDVVQSISGGIGCGE